MHLAQLNVGRLRYPLDDPRLAEFMDNLDRVNALAERMPGFVWRLQDDGGNATAFRISDDPQVIANMSVWENAQALEAYVFQTLHAKFYKRRGDWFEAFKGPHLVFWWIEAGHRPTLAEAGARLRHLADNGPTEHAFGWAELIDIERWRSQRCA
jgi:heme-degrading monooxygenase HmoA